MSGAKVTVTFTREEADDTQPDTSHLQQDYSEVTDPIERQKYLDSDKERLKGLQQLDWYFIGIRAVATIWIQRDGYRTKYTMKSPGIWGVESDSGEEYLEEVYEDECATLRRDIEAIITGPIEWKGQS